MPPPKAPIPDAISENKALVDTAIRQDRMASEYELRGELLVAEPLRAPNEQWVEETLGRLTLPEKVGQLFISPGTALGEEQIKKYHIGGFVFMGNSQRAEDIVAAVNRLQKVAAIPLWFAIDSEAGLGARVADATIFPLLAAFGAADDDSAAEWCGRITARESRALGLHVTFGPVVDVNTEPRNPIISTRAYGSSAEQVTRLGRAHICGTTREGNLSTLKHYPGHGASSGDSHHDLPVLPLSEADWRAHHLLPFQELIKTGNVDLIMTAHLSFPNIDSRKDWPATLSNYFNETILREELGFDGILVSDSFDMRGITSVVTDPFERGVIGIETGLDVILGTAPEELGATWQGLLNAVQSGRISEERVDKSVRRVLRAKSRAGLPENAFVNESRWREVLNHPEHREKVREVCKAALQKSLASVADFRPLDPQESLLVLPLQGSQRIFYRFPASLFCDALSGHGILFETFPIPHRPDEKLIRDVCDFGEKVRRVLVLGYDWWSIGSEEQVALIHALAARGCEVSYLGFGSPHQRAQLPAGVAFLCAYSSVREMQEAAARAILPRR